MTTATANYTNKTNGTSLARIGVVLRTMFARFIQANEFHAALSSAYNSNKAESAEQLRRMASSFESSQPNLAAELRYIASRG